MDHNIEKVLSDKHAELYSAIRKKGTEELGLPIKISNSIICFGRILDFSMFWIFDHRGKISFGARKRFTRSRRDNLVNIEFDEANLYAILNAIDTIYHSYVAAATNGGIDRELQRIEIKRSRRTEKNKIPKELNEAQLLWKDLTSSVYEKSKSDTLDTNIIDEEAITRFSKHGKRFVELYNEIPSILTSNSSGDRIRNMSIYLEYVESDTTTLSQIAAKYDLSRERIRQIVNNTGKRNRQYFMGALRNNNSAIKIIVEEIASILEAVDHDMLHLTVYGMAEISHRKKESIINTLFEKALAQAITEKVTAITNQIKEQDDLIQKKKATLEALEFYLSKVIYPSSPVVDDSLLVSSYEVESRFSFEVDFYNKIKAFEPFIKIIQNPDIVYYSSSQTDHRPHFLLQLPDKANVLVLLMNTVNMAFIYNIQRCNALHIFCKEKGYGYLIIDDRGNSIYDIKSRRLDEELVATLNNILNSQSMIVWKNIKEIKQTRPVPNEDIAAYVLQNRLYFTMEPFCIKRR